MDTRTLMAPCERIACTKSQGLTHSATSVTWAFRRRARGGMEVHRGIQQDVPLWLCGMNTEKCSYATGDESADRSWRRWGGEASG